MYNRFEDEFQSFDSTTLYYRCWTHPEARATLLITHGLAEHSGCYERLVDGLKLPMDVVAWDLRGHGRSPGRRGYVASFEHYIQDWLAFKDHILQTRQGKPLVVLGHSLGGLIQLGGLVHLREKQKEVAAQILSSPLLAVAVDVPWIKDRAAHLLQRVWPQLTLGNEINFSQLTRDPLLHEEFSKDPFRHDRISSEVYLGILRVSEQVRRQGDQLQLPTLLQIAGQDSVVSVSANKEFFPSLASAQKTLKCYPASMHEIYNDLDRQQAYADLRDFLAQTIEV